MKYPRRRTSRFVTASGTALTLLALLVHPASAKSVHSSRSAPLLDSAASSTLVPGPECTTDDRRHIAVPRLAAGPRVDGLLDPGEWGEAASVSSFTQVDPDEGQPSTQGMTVLLARTADTIFLAFDVRDTSTRRVRAHYTTRDAVAPVTDFVGFMVDPSRQKRRAHYFWFSPRGVQHDGIWSRSFDDTWDTVLRSAGRTTEAGYVVEVALPLASVGVGQADTTWDANFHRFIWHAGERSWWAPLTRAVLQDRLRCFGTLSDLAAERGRAGFGEVIPTLAQRVVRASGPSAGLPSELDPSAARTTWPALAWGATLRTRFDRRWTGAGRFDATFRPDFSTVDADVPQLAFNERFALYLPEKRPFFLEGKDRFETAGFGPIADPLRLVHTRMIGQPRAGIRILAAPAFSAKGQGAPLRLGVLATTDETDARVRSSDSFIGRATWESSPRVRLGGFLTHRQAVGDGLPDDPMRRNTVAAADAIVRLPASATLVAQIGHATTRTAGGGGAGIGRGIAAYADVSRDDGTYVTQVAYTGIGRDFATSLGFVPRVDLNRVRVMAQRFFRRPGDDRWRYTAASLALDLNHDARWRPAERLATPAVEVELARQTWISLSAPFGTESYRGNSYRRGGLRLDAQGSPTDWLDVTGHAGAGRAVRYLGEPVDSVLVDRSFAARFGEVGGGGTVRIGPGIALAGSASYRVLGGGRGIGSPTAIPRSAAWVGQARGDWFLSRTTRVRALVGRGDAGARSDASLLLAHELDYGTQYHLGVGRSVERASAIAPGSAGTARTTTVFVRLSRLVNF